VHHPGSSKFTEVIREIRAAWNSRHDRTPPENKDLIELALRRMQADLRSGRRAEVIEEVRREVAYQRWCTQGGMREETPKGHFGI